MGDAPNKPARVFWHQGFHVGPDGVVRFQRQRTRDHVAAMAKAAGHWVETADGPDWFGFRKASAPARTPAQRIGRGARTKAAGTRVGGGTG